MGLFSRYAFHSHPLNVRFEITRLLALTIGQYSLDGDELLQVPEFLVALVREGKRTSVLEFTDRQGNRFVGDEYPNKVESQFNSWLLSLHDRLGR